MRYSAAWPVYAEEWDRMVINPIRVHTFDELARYAIKHKDQYRDIEKLSGVPWAMVAVIHRRESEGNFLTYLGNGQPLHMRTTLVPRGRGPFRNFTEGAIDALRIDGLTAVSDWRLEKQLFFMTSFNGWAAAYGFHSPYIWGGTNVQRRGKFIADGVFDPNVWDTQPGCAPLLKTIATLDPSIVFTREN